MKVSDFLAKAANCKSNKDVENLADLFREEMYQDAGLYGNRLTLANDQASIELDEDNPSVFMEFELNHLISQDYVISIRPVLRRGDLTVLVRTVQMRDRLGMDSHSWAGVPDLDEEIEPRAFWTLPVLLEQAVNEVKRQHSELMERAGVPRELATSIVESHWQGGKP